MDAFKFLLQKAAKLAKSFKSRFCKETFVIFASFCSNFFERLFTEGNEGNKRFDLFGSPSLSSFPSVYVFFLLAALLRIGLDD
jgi:hypothetical protein